MPTENKDEAEVLFYADNNEKWRKLKIVKSFPKFSTGGIIKDNYFVPTDNNGTVECFVRIKKIKKKRFLKLVMSNRYQRNEAFKIHEKYMESYDNRNLIGLVLFLSFYKRKEESSEK